MDDDPELAAIRARKLAALTREAETAAPGADAAPGAPTAPSWPDGMVEVTDATLPEAVARFPVALVDCWAPWCGPCRVLTPTLEALATEMKGQVAFLKLNVDQNPRTAQTYGIASIPTMLLFRGGRLADAMVGALPKPQIVQRLRAHLARRGTPGPRRV